MSVGAGSAAERVTAGRLLGRIDRHAARGSLSGLHLRPAAAGNPPGGQAGLICLASWLVIATLRGLAASCTGMARVSTPAV